MYIYLKLVQLSFVANKVPKAKHKYAGVAEYDLDKESSYGRCTQRHVIQRSSGGCN